MTVRLLDDIPLVHTIFLSDVCHSGQIYSFETDVNFH